jgi:hypothetical protein
MKRIWITIGLILTVFLIVGFAGAYWVGDYLFQSMLKIGNVEQFEQTIQTPLNPPESSTTPTQETNSGEAKADSMVAAVSTEDKLSIALLVSGNLTKQDVAILFQMVLDGELTTEEKKAAIDLCYQRFSPEEVEKLKTFFEKYKGNISIVP